MNRTFKHIATGSLALAMLTGGGMVALSPAALPTAQAATTPAGILPTPQEVSATGTAVPLTGNVRVSVGSDTDPAAKNLLDQVIDQAGGTATFVEGAAVADATVLLGTTAENTALPASLTAVGATSADTLAAGGYVIATGAVAGKPKLVLNGKDATGTYYAVQSLSQVVTGGAAPAMQVKDWPLMSIRGAIEGFYGIPWSHQARLDQLDFYGKHKMNTYIYTPKDDKYLRTKWREPYPAGELAKLKELVDEAKANHVNFTFALSPGNDVCYSDGSDFDATVAKFEQLRAIGVSSFYIALDDIDPYLKCAADKATFTSAGFRALADGQAFYLNRVVKDYIQVHQLQPLQTVPTNYAGSGPDAYKDQFGLQTDPSILIQWTGEGVFSDAITEASVARAVQTYNAEHFYIWDNLPVNDGQRGRLFLNPLEGRDPNLYKHIDGITSNPMIEPYASMIALAGFGDYSWNSPAYVPANTQAAIISELAGPDLAVRSSLEAFVDLNQSWKPYRPDSKSAPALSADVSAFWAARAAGTSEGTQALKGRLAIIKAAPETLAQMAMMGFYHDSQPWIEAAAQWATAMENQINMLEAIDRGDGVAATDATLAAAADMALAKRATVDNNNEADGSIIADVIVPAVGDGVFETFTGEAQKQYNTWLNISSAVASEKFAATATSSLPSYQSNATNLMVDGDVSTKWWSSQPPAVGSTVTVDLGSVQDIGRVLIQQAATDTSAGDMLYHARGEYSSGGVIWTEADTFDNKPRIEQNFDNPISARYVRMVATETNPGGQWVQVREFQVFSAAQGLSSDLVGAAGTGVSSAFDANIDTAFASSAIPVEGSHLTRTLDAPEEIQSIVVVGYAAGELQVETESGWITLGSLDPERSFQEAALTQGSISGARILFAPGIVNAASPGPVVYELGLRASGPVSAGPYIGEVVEPTPTGTATPTQSSTPAATAPATAPATASATAPTTSSARATGAATTPAASSTAAAGSGDGLAHTGFTLSAAGGIALALMLGGLLLARRKKLTRH